jgi:hypothetical protein
LNLDYKIEIPESNFFSDEEILFNTEESEESENEEKKSYNDSEIFNPYD